MYRSRILIFLNALVFLTTITMSPPSMAGQTVQQADQGQSFLGKLIRAVQENPLESAFVVSATLLAGYAGYVFLKPRPNAQAIAGGHGALAAAHGLPGANRHAPVGHGAQRGAPRGFPPLNSGAHQGPDANLAKALLLSKKEHDFLQKHIMRPVDFTFNVDVFRQLSLIEDTAERILFVQALLYNFEQRFLPRAHIQAFVESIQNLSVESALEAYQEFARGEGWSLLGLAQELGELNPHEPVQMMDFRALLAELTVWRQRVINNWIEMATVRLEIRNRYAHPFDQALIDLMVRYWWEVAGNEPLVTAPIIQETYERARLIVEQLRGEEFQSIERIEIARRAPIRLAPVEPAQRPAAQMPASLLPTARVNHDGSPQEQLSREELARRRMEYLDKQKARDH